MSKLILIVGTICIFIQAQATLGTLLADSRTDKLTEMVLKHNHTCTTSALITKSESKGEISIEEARSQRNLYINNRRTLIREMREFVQKESLRPLEIIIAIYDAQTILSAQNQRLDCVPRIDKISSLQAFLNTTDLVLSQMLYHLELDTQSRERVLDRSFRAVEEFFGIERFSALSNTLDVDKRNYFVLQQLSDQIICVAGDKKKSKILNQSSSELADKLELLKQKLKISSQRKNYKSTQEEASINQFSESLEKFFCRSLLLNYTSDDLIETFGEINDLYDRLKVRVKKP